MVAIDTGIDKVEHLSFFLIEQPELILIISRKSSFSILSAHPFKAIVFLIVLKTLSNLIWSNELTKVPDFTLSKMNEYLKSQNCQQRRKPGQAVGAPTLVIYTHQSRNWHTQKRKGSVWSGEGRNWRNHFNLSMLFLPQIESFPASRGKRIKKLLAYNQVPFGH